MKEALASAYHGDGSYAYAMLAARMLQLAPCPVRSEHDDDDDDDDEDSETDSETDQQELYYSLGRQMDERTEQIMRGLIRHSKAPSRVERRLEFIKNGIREAQSKD